MTAKNLPNLPLLASVLLIGATLVVPFEYADAARGNARATGQTSVNRPAANANTQRGGGANRAAANTGTQRGGGANRAAANTNAQRGAAANTSSSGRTVNRSTSVSSSTHVNIEVDGNHNGCCDNDWGDGDLDDNPLAKAAIVTGTIAAIGSIVRQPPPNCVPVNYQNVAYQQCGSTWYQPQYSGSNVQYVVVNPPY